MDHRDPPGRRKGEGRYPLDIEIPGPGKLTSTGGKNALGSCGGTPGPTIRPRREVRFKVTLKKKEGDSPKNKGQSLEKVIRLSEAKSTQPFWDRRSSLRRIGKGARGREMLGAPSAVNPPCD